MESGVGGGGGWGVEREREGGEAFKHILFFPSLLQNRFPLSLVHIIMTYASFHEATISDTDQKLQRTENDKDPAIFPRVLQSTVFFA